MADSGGIGWSYTAATWIVALALAGCGGDDVVGESETAGTTGATESTATDESTTGEATTTEAATTATATEGSEGGTTASETTGVAPECGNGVVEGDEECDDGNADNTDACLDSCVHASCGDGFVWSANEECDDGNAEDGDACTNACAAAVCGDGILHEGVEACDDGNAEDGDACTNACAEAVCGDGVVHEGIEVCDDGDGLDNACSNACEVQEVVFLTAGGDHNCALLGDKRVKCWGQQSGFSYEDQDTRGDEPGEMGADLPAVDLGANAEPVALTSHNAFNCALLASSAVKCWGFNNHGQLGQEHSQVIGNEPGEMGDALETTDLGADVVPVSVVAGFQHVCALFDDGRVKCWGLDAFGQLGLGGTPGVSRGDSPGDMGDNLPYVDLGAGQQATALALGLYHSCALLDGGEVKCWGEGFFLGQGTSEHLGDDPNEMGDNLPPIELGAPAVAIAAWGRHTCALLETGAVKCWGLNQYGQLGLGDTELRGDEPGEMANLPAVELGAGFEPVEIAVTAHSSCVRSQEGKVKCWGQNIHGELGLGDTANRGDMPGEMGDALPELDLDGVATTLVGGGGHMCARLQDSSYKCWGYNTDGVLGLGDTEHRGDDPGEMGAALPLVHLFSDVW